MPSSIQSSWCPERMRLPKMRATREEEHSAKNLADGRLREERRGGTDKQGEWESKGTSDFDLVLLQRQGKRWDSTQASAFKLMWTCQWNLNSPNSALLATRLVAPVVPARLSNDGHPQARREVGGQGRANL